MKKMRENARRLLGLGMRNIHQSWFVVFLCVGIVAGMILGLVFRINYFASPVWIGFAILTLVLLYIWPKYMFVGVAILAGMVLAFFRVANELAGEDYIRQFYGQTVMVTGKISGDPETDEKGTKLKLYDLKFGEGEYGIRGNIYVMLRKNEEIRRSDTVVLEGEMESGFGTYVGYMYQPKVVKVLKPEPGDWVLKIRDWFAERVRKLIPEPQVNLGMSYLMGMKTGLPDDLEDNLRMVGLVHIVMASGTHLAILVEVAKKIFGRFSRFAGVLFSGMFVVIFMAMVGWTPSILRAGIMTLLTIAAWYVGRKFEPWRIILLVMAGTLMVEPMFLINLGWLLSFASFGGIMILGPKFTKFFYGGKKPSFVAEMIITTVAATLMTLPIVLYYYGTISLVSVVANLLILPTLPYAMGLVFLTGVVCGVPFVETVVAWCATRLLEFHIGVVEFFGEMKSFVVEIEPYQGWVFGIYGLIILWLAVDYLWKKLWYNKKHE